MKYKGASISFPVWGKTYIDIFERLTLPSLLAAGNIPYLASETDVHVTFYSTTKYFKNLRNSKSVRKLKQYAKIKYEMIPEDNLIKYAPLKVMNECQKKALIDGFSKKHILMPFTSDVFLTEDLLKTGLTKIKDGFRCVVGSGLRCNQTKVLTQIAASGKVVLPISNLEAVKIAIKERHIFTKRQTLNSKRFIYSAELYEETRNGLFSRCFGLAPFMLLPKALAKLPGITFDDAFIDKLFPDEEEICILVDALCDGGIYSVTDEKTYATPDLCDINGYSPFIYAEKIHHLIQQGNLGKTHIFYFKHKISYCESRKKSNRLAAGHLDKDADLILKLVLQMQKKAEDIKNWNNKELGNLKNGFFVKYRWVIELTKNIDLNINYFNSLKNRNINILTRYIFLNHPLNMRRFFSKSNTNNSKDKFSQRSSLFERIIYLTRPFSINLIFLSHCVFAPHKASGLIGVYGAMHEKPFSATLLRKIRNGLWPFVMFTIWQAGSSLSFVKTILLKVFGMRGGRHCKICRGVYFKNPWNVVIRPFCEIGQDVIFDSPSKPIELGHRARICQRSVLSSVSLQSAENGFTDAINQKMKIGANSVIKTNSIIEPKI